MRFGHRPYAEAKADDLTDVGPYRRSGRAVRLLPPARDAFRKMADAAAGEGIKLVPISGFREAAYQEMLFKKAVEKHGSGTAAARWVAPPGHSEHHTGLALDIGDGAVPGADVEPEFEDTPAFRWLREHAGRFGFELSFPKDNPCLVAYEPWHWRFTGSPSCREVFHVARQQEVQTIP